MGKHEKFYPAYHEKQELRRQTMWSILLFLLVLVLAIAFCVTYFHARGGFVR